MSPQQSQVFDVALALAPGPYLESLRRSAGFLVFASPVFPVTLRDGIAVIQVSGPFFAGAYDELSATVDAALRDPRVRGLLLDVDSPGGRVSGLFDLTDQIYALRGEKPVWAIAADLATSAAYAIASAAEQVWTTPTGLLGSIGVISLHVDQSTWNEREGFRVTEVVTGARKADLSPHRALSTDALALLQDVVNDAGEMFFATVSRHRGLAFEAIRAQQAQIFRAPDALAAGLVDRVGSRAEVLAEFGRFIQTRAAAQEAQALVEAERQAYAQGFARVWRSAQPVGLSTAQVLDLKEIYGNWDAALERVQRLGPGALISDASLARWNSTGGTDRRRGAVR